MGRVIEFGWRPTPDASWPSPTKRDALISLFPDGSSWGERRAKRERAALGRGMPLGNRGSILYGDAHALRALAGCAGSPPATKLFGGEGKSVSRASYFG